MNLWRKPSIASSSDRFNYNFLCRYNVSNNGFHYGSWIEAVLIVALFSWMNLFRSAVFFSLFAGGRKKMEINRRQCVPHNTCHRHLFCCQQTKCNHFFFLHSKASDSCRLFHNNSNVRLFLCNMQVLNVVGEMDGVV